jgi:hypothetical protein
VPKPCEFKGSGDAHGGQSILKIDPNPHPCERIRAGIHMGRKIMNRRTLTTMVLLGLAVATALPQIAFAQSDPFVGTWQLNLAKSKYSPGPPPKSQTSNTQAEGQNLKFALTGTGANGNPISVTLTAVNDGMPHPATAVPDNPNAAYDAAATTRVDAHTLIISFTKAGKLVQIDTLIVSPDGKTTTVTRTGADANGRQVNDISVWDKQ